MLHSKTLTSESKRERIKIISSFKGNMKGCDGKSEGMGHEQPDGSHCTERWLSGKGLAAKTDEPSLIPGTHRVEGENCSLASVFVPPYPQINKYLKKISHKI